MEEALHASESIEATLDGAALSAWQTFKVSSAGAQWATSNKHLQEGYLTFHISQDRYRLSDISRALEPLAQPPMLKAEDEGIESGLPVHGCIIVALALVSSSLTYFLI